MKLQLIATAVVLMSFNTATNSNAELVNLESNYYSEDVRAFEMRISDLEQQISYLESSQLEVNNDESLVKEIEILTWQIKKYEAAIACRTINH